MAHVPTRQTKFLNIITDQFDDDDLSLFRKYITSDSLDDDLTLFGETKVLEVLFKDSTVEPHEDAPLLTIFPDPSKLHPNTTTQMVRNSYSQIGFKYYYEPLFDYLQNVFIAANHALSTSFEKKENPAQLIARLNSTLHDLYMQRLTNDLNQLFTLVSTDTYQDFYLANPYLRSDWNMNPELQEITTDSLMYSHFTELISLLRDQIKDKRLNEFLTSPLAYTTLLNYSKELKIPVFIKLFPPSMLKHAHRKLFGKRKGKDVLDFHDLADNPYNEEALKLATSFLTNLDPITMPSTFIPFAKFFAKLRPTVNLPIYYNPDLLDAKTIMTRAPKVGKPSSTADDEHILKDPPTEGSSSHSVANTQPEEESTPVATGTNEMTSTLIDALDKIPIKIFNYKVYSTELDTSNLRDLLKERALENSFPTLFTDISIVPDTYLDPIDQEPCITNSELLDDTITIKGDKTFENERFAIFRDSYSRTLFIIKISMTNWSY